MPPGRPIPLGQDSLILLPIVTASAD